MARVIFAPALARWLHAHPTGTSQSMTVEVPSGTVREALEVVFALHPKLRGYVLEERGGLRHHVVAYLDGEVVPDKEALAGTVEAESELHIFQALSGG
jgi:molybdopterin synthase sulfur carrier subunit